ncbi:hypothetical protein L6164_033289 [Bauhinia variegata]|uniref:Uncharacterized protein n=1 Tax=Bauhinia variegata TaxID=167791 RepID=A0ACB9KRN7_BAUVA|nr:hypothetical protein L6164_033289 [Bauhinia variegata]
MDSEDIIDCVLDGLDNDYQSVVDTVHARDTPISFDELHEKLINKELALYHKPAPTLFSAVAHLTVAPHHVTFDLANLSLHHPYDGIDTIVISDGPGLPISNTGYAFLPYPSKSFKLDNVLHALSMH